MTPDLVVLGNLITDDVVHDDGRTRMAQAGGATLYAALGAALWGVSVGVVTVLGDDYPEPVLAALRSRGVDLAGARPFGRPGLRTWLLYEGRRRRVLHRLGGPTHAEVSPGLDDVPEAWWGSRAFHLAPMPFELQCRLAAGLSQRTAARISVDPYELLDRERVAAWRAFQPDVDVLFFSEDEMAVASGLDDPVPVLAELCGGSLQTVLYKRGARGGLVYDGCGGSATRWAPRSAAVVDPTGAGDAFAGGVLAGRLLGEPVARAVERGVVSASFALEGHGAGALLAATPESAAARWQDWRG